jgi:hypothetical protein
MLVYDVGALLAADAQNRRIWTLHYVSLQAGLLPVVPAVALAQIFRDGARQANLVRLLKGCRELPLDGELARRVGGLCETAGMDNTVDAIETAVVAVVAADHAATVVTSDPGDLAHLLSHLHRGEQVDIVLV